MIEVAPSQTQTWLDRHAICIYMTYFMYLYLCIVTKYHYKAGLVPIPPGGGGDVGALFAALARGFVS